MRHYETTYILRPNLGEDQFSEIIERTNAIITDDGGSIIEVDCWGIKKLAYEIKKETQGYYVYMSYAAPGSTIQEVERIFRIDDRVLRYLTVKLADEIDEAGIDQEKEKIAAIEAAKAAEIAEAEAEELAGQNEEAGSEKSDSDVVASDKDSAPEQQAAEPESGSESNKDNS